MENTDEPSLYHSILGYLKDSSLAYVEKFIPYMLCSIGCHLINLENLRRPFYYEHRKSTDLRLSVIFCAPPGFSKSTFLKVLLQHPHGVFANSGLETTFEGYMTEAGWVGTKRLGKEGEEEDGFEHRGLAWEYREGVVGIEEFSAITKAMHQDHSVGLDSAILDTLDGGDVKKRLAGGALKYQTAVTLLAGTQIARFDLTSGLGRRIFFIIWNPSGREIDTLRDAYWNGSNMPPDRLSLDSLRNRIMNLTRDLQYVRRITYPDSLKKILYDEGLMPYELPLFRRLALGYYVMAKPLQEELVMDVQKGDELHELIKQGVKWRKLLMRDLRFAQIEEIIRQYGACTIMQMMEYLGRFGVREDEAQELIQNMLKNRTVRIDATDKKLHLQ